MINLQDKQFETLEENFITNDTSITYDNAWDYKPTQQIPQNFQCGGVDNVNKYLKVDIDGYIRLAEGTGGTPANYLARIVKDEDNKTITITDNNLNNTTFEYGGGGSGEVSKAYVDNQDEAVLQSANDNTQNKVNDLSATLNQAIREATDQIEQLWYQVDTKSVVSGSATGSSTNPIYYLTINGTEYLLPQGGAGTTLWGGISGNIENQTDLILRFSNITSDYTNKINTERTERQDADNTLRTAINSKSEVIASTQSVSGATTIHSINIDGNDFNLPQGGSGTQEQADWTQTDTTAVDYIKNKPTLAVVATTGNYNDLLNKPSIPGADKFLTKTGQNIAGGTYQFEYDHYDDYNVRIERLNGDAGSLISPVGIMITTTPDVPGAGEYTLYGRNVITNQTADNQTTLIVPDNGGIQTLATLSDIPASLSKQVILDMTHPINSTYVQYTDDDNPNTLFNKGGEYTSAWTDITSTLHERFIQFDNSHSVGTLKDAGLPDITGRFSVGPKLQQTTATNVEALAVYNLGGCFSSFKNSSPVITDIDADYTRTGDEGYGNIVNFQASRSSSLYGKYSSSVMPKTYTAKLWKRTA